MICSLESLALLPLPSPLEILSKWKMDRGESLASAWEELG